MTANMHCRLTCLTDNNLTHPSTYSQPTNILKEHTYSPESYHDQIPATSTSLRRFRRLEDPIINFASNYYVIHPPQICHTPSPTLDRIRSKSNEKHIYCDLFNLLENSPTIKPRRKHLLNDSNSFRRHRSIVYKNMHTKIKDFQERKRQHSQQENRSSKKQEDKTKNQRLLSNNSFFRRVVRQYFCMPMTIHNRDLSN